MLSTSSCVDDIMFSHMSRMMCGESVAAEATGCLLTVVVV